LLPGLPALIQAAREGHQFRKSPLDAESKIKQGGAGHGAASPVPITRHVKVAAIERLKKRAKPETTTLIGAQGAKSLRPAVKTFTRPVHMPGGAGMLPRAPVISASRARVGGASLGVPRTPRFSVPLAGLGGAAHKYAVNKSVVTARPAGQGGVSTGVLPSKSATASAQPRQGGAARLLAPAAVVSAAPRVGGASQRAAKQADSVSRPSMSQGGSSLGRRVEMAAPKVHPLQGGAAARCTPAVRQVASPMQGGSVLSARMA